MWSPTKAKGAAAAKKPEQQLFLAAVYALCLAAAVVGLARTHLLHNFRASPLCDGASCSVSSSLRGAQQLLREAARKVAAQHSEAMALGIPVQRLKYEKSMAGAPSGGGEDEEEEGGGADAVLEEVEEELAAAGADGRSQPAGTQRSEEEEEQEEQEVEAGSSRQEPPGGDEEGAEGEEEEEEAGRTSAPSPYQLAVEDCADLACLSKAGRLGMHPGQFRFPSFFIVGWQKCATTSLFWHLKNHPQVLAADNKEPEFFSDDCGYDPAACSRKDTRRYLFDTMRLGEAVEGGMRAAAVEASTHYGRNGHLLAAPVYEVFPWLKVIISMREPISRAISMLAHNLDKHGSGCLTKDSVFKCLERDLQRDTYGRPFAAWLDAYPPDQVFLIQYENITSTAHGSDVLHAIKNRLGIDPELPGSDLGIRNTREYHLMRKGELKEGEQADGWPMKKWQYQSLVDMVRPDAQTVADLADRHGLADGRQWMRNWEAEWKATLEECGADGNCVVFPN